MNFTNKNTYIKKFLLKNKNKRQQDPMAEWGN
jgi:hypothetical protein